MLQCSLTITAHNGQQHLLSLHPGISLPGVVVHRLKKQNDDLFKDLDQKSKRISQLENEKAVLIRELFDARAQAADNYDQRQNGGGGRGADKTFM